MNRKGIITINKLDWAFGQHKILHDINLTIYEGGIYGIIGPNGSGKTTLLKNIARCLMPEKNSIQLGDKDLTQFSNRSLAKEISYVPQNTDMEFEFSVMDMVLMGRSPYIKRLQSESSNDIEIAKSAMEMTNTWDLRDKNINMISGGERQRTVIARALAQKANIMLLDEPVSQLDLHHQLEIMDILKRLAVENKVTVVMSIHDLNIAAQFCDRLILMDKGKIFKEGIPNDIIKEDIVYSVYGVKAIVMKNPVTGTPHLIPYGNQSDLHLKSAGD
ncbi:ABC transporter ATP-binding protein [Pseudobacteroides cellulosolvens]|uniref:Iron-chelate-transporting ATPase n=1 Tax=Pseudobacteroides cellulosolvens ATCC 35603 = DSM 2933 TaxID=398512 RepID=A0A0L6JUE2_9FIRM|nr:ABC transporter ATP-binding protein [Pseudobacteroides cellulosolvens]KNY29339.1 Iron-chelate-transporting ATPase [Pseudobacteroides cellulosolvens ATCC 35603 = DSM 2933]